MLNRLTLLTLAATVCAAAPLVAGQPRKIVATSAADAGADYLVQGEYVGKVEGKDSGAQVIALGNGKFDVVLYTGGLPGAGWTRENPKQKVAGETQNNVTTFKSDKWTAKLENGVLSMTSGDAAIGELKKTERKSPTLGAKPPEGAIVLFDGKGADKWKGGRVTEDGLLMVGTETKDKFGSHTLHIEFRLPFQPSDRGQGRGNSGVYIQGRHECQVLDSFGLEGKNNECGGIYTVAEPIVNACFPPLAWQTYDIEYTAAKYDENGKKTENARATIKHNGILIHDNLDLKNGTPGKYGEGPGPETLYVQDHGNPVHFRNVWIVEKK